MYHIKVRVSSFGSKLWHPLIAYMNSTLTKLLRHGMLFTIKPLRSLCIPNAEQNKNALAIEYNSTRTFVNMPAITNVFTY